MAGGSAVVQPWCLLLQLRRGFIAAFASGPIPVAAVLATFTKTTAVAVAKTEAAFLAFAFAIRFAHHGRGSFLVLINPDGEIAQHVLAEPFLAFDLIERGRRRFDIEEREMCLTIFFQPVGERF